MKLSIMPASSILASCHFSNVLSGFIIFLTIESSEMTPMNSFPVLSLMGNWLKPFENILFATSFSFSSE